MSATEPLAGDRPRTARVPLRAYTPRLLFCLVVLAVAPGLVTHLRHYADPVQLTAGLLAAVYLGWLALEIPVTFRRATAPPAESATLLWYATARIATAVAAATGPLPWHRWSPWLLLPAAVFLAGIALRQIAIHTLGRFYSHHVMRQQDHRIVSGGPYRVIRHPAYAGMLLAHLGFVGFFLNPFSAALLPALAVAVVHRIRTEERLLLTVPGYRAYAVGRARLCPRVW
ncbi:isoprenylcysteine carboxylmethyltransferase family protein [Streptomyces sp. NPDC006733]|uniref:methyltransferase family protein n=1 Tax=Streptomyces sp. NPDC006733 TaxID=3155460 RepID=UPI00340436D8